jgi:superfamily I DNA and/or RNA helicase
MHQIIREFPSAYFYGGRLEDGFPPGSKAAQWHKDVRFGPLVVRLEHVMCNVACFEELLA